MTEVCSRDYAARMVLKFGRIDSHGQPTDPIAAGAGDGNMPGPSAAATSAYARLPVLYDTDVDVNLPPPPVFTFVAEQDHVGSPSDRLDSPLGPDDLGIFNNNLPRALSDAGTTNASNDGDAAIPNFMFPSVHDVYDYADNIGSPNHSVHTPTDDRVTRSRSREPVSDNRGSPSDDDGDSRASDSLSVDGASAVANGQVDIHHDELVPEVPAFPPESILHGSEDVVAQLWARARRAEVRRVERAVRRAAERNQSEDL